MFVSQGGMRMKRRPRHHYVFPIPLVFGIILPDDQSVSCSHIQHYLISERKAPPTYLWEPHYHPAESLQFDCRREMCKTGTWIHTEGDREEERGAQWILETRKSPGSTESPTSAKASWFSQTTGHCFLSWFIQPEEEHLAARSFDRWRKKERHLCFCRPLPQTIKHMAVSEWSTQAGSTSEDRSSPEFLRCALSRQ